MFRDLGYDNADAEQFKAILAALRRWTVAPDLRQARGPCSKAMKITRTPHGEDLLKPQLARNAQQLS